MDFHKEIRIIATGPCITNQLRDVSTICRRSWYIAAHIWKIYDSKIGVTYRHIHNILSINNPRFAEFLPLIYPPELEIKETTDTASSASFFFTYTSNLTRFWGNSDSYEFKINRLEEGHNSYPLVCWRPADTVPLQRRQTCYRWLFWDSKLSKLIYYISTRGVPIIAEDAIVPMHFCHRTLWLLTISW
jgi:hypothetical protein